MPKERPIRNADDLGEFLSEWGKELGMPDEDDEDAYKSECPACGWTGQITETVFENNEFYCPSCKTMFISRTE